MIQLPVPEEVLADTDFKKTKKIVEKQLLDIKIAVSVKEYHADVYYNPKTGEPDRTWNRQMHSLIEEMIHYRKGITGSDAPDPFKVSAYEERYRKILLKAKEEYDYIPPGKYYRDRYNL